MNVNARVFELQLNEAISKQKGFEKLEAAFERSQKSIVESQEKINNAINELENASVERLDTIETEIAQRNAEKIAEAKGAEDMLAARKAESDLIRDKEFRNELKKEVKLMRQEQKIEKILGGEFKSTLNYDALKKVAAANLDIRKEAVDKLPKEQLVHEGKKSLAPLNRLRNIVKNVETKIAASLKRIRSNRAALDELVAEMRREKEEKRTAKDVAAFKSRRVRLDELQMRMDIEKSFIPYAGEMAEVIKHAADLASMNRAGFAELDAEALHAEISSLTKERSACLEAQDIAMRAVAKQVDNMNLLYATKNEAIAMYKEEVNNAREKAATEKAKELGLKREDVLKLYPGLEPISLQKAQADIMKTPQFENFFEDVAECEKAINQANIELNQYKSRDIEIRAQLSEIVSLQHDEITKSDMNKINDGRVGISQIFRQNSLAESGIRADLLVGMPADKAKAAQLAIDMGVPVDFLNEHIKDMTPEALQGVALVAIETDATQNKSAMVRITKALNMNELSVKSINKDFATTRTNEATKINEAAKQATAYKNELSSALPESIAVDNEQKRNVGIFSRMKTAIDEKVSDINKAIKAATIGYKDTEIKAAKPKSNDMER